MISQAWPGIVKIMTYLPIMPLVSSISYGCVVHGFVLSIFWTTKVLIYPLVFALGKTLRSTYEGPKVNSVILCGDEVASVCPLLVCLMRTSTSNWRLEEETCHVGTAFWLVPWSWVRNTLWTQTGFAYCVCSS